MSQNSSHSTHASWIKRVQARAASNSHSPEIRLIQSGIRCMLYSTILISALEVYRWRQNPDAFAHIAPSSVVPTLNTADSLLDDAEHVQVQSQIQLDLDRDTITTLSSQVVQLNDGIHQYNASLIWLYVLATTIWIMSVTTFIISLKRLSFRNASTTLVSGLGSASFALALAMYRYDFEHAWTYAAVCLTPAFVVMTVVLSLFGIDGGRDGDKCEVGESKEEDEVGRLDYRD